MLVDGSNGRRCQAQRRRRRDPHERCAEHRLSSLHPAPSSSAVQPVRAACLGDVPPSVSRRADNARNGWDACRARFASRPPRSKAPCDTATGSNTTRCPSPVQAGFLQAFEPSAKTIAAPCRQKYWMRVLVAICTFCALTATFPAPAAPAAVGDADTAALQVALRAAGAYLGTIDGLRGPDTEEALVSFQERVGLVPDGIAGPRTRRALGELGAPDLGSRPLTIGARGWDVAELQFKLAWHGFPSGPFDGAFGPRLEAAVQRFQRFADIPSIGVAGSRTMAALARPLPTSPLDVSAPVAAPVGDGFGPRGGAFHAGVDFVAPAGTPVVSARGRARRMGGRARKLRQHGGRPARSRRADALCPPFTDRRRSARPRVDRHGSRPRRLDRAVDRPASPLRGARARRSRRPARRVSD